ncbi:GNAT family N-acetyltransferase [Cellulomonas fimi]|uniref:GNAT family N-acetyltransferase n=1 Tax=Cellulomonas fimi TaxID=1708 RepID=A0A7Y0LXM3_CELFI|nr:GNAT family N-acetyltransferase [Cellulomonas fimi]NMR20142.1 GNAT family N-acetyltransferase [Cellulomonas fimi]
MRGSSERGAVGGASASRTGGGGPRAVAARTVHDLPEPWCTEPYLVGEFAAAGVLAAWADDTALLAVVDGAGRPPGLVGIGAADRLAELVGEAAVHDAALLASVRFATLARGASERLDPDAAAVLRHLDGPASDWDWFWVDRPLAGADPGHAVAERLADGPGTVAEVRDFLAVGHPEASTAPDDPRLLGWWGAREAGRLVAVVGAMRFAPGLAPHLVSLGVDPRRRGRRLAAAVLRAAVRDCLELRPAVGAPMVTLGMYADNEAARRVYERLGFEQRHAFSSRRPSREPHRSGGAAQRRPSSSPNDGASA